MNILFLDDDEVRHKVVKNSGEFWTHEVTHVRTVEQAVAALAGGARFDIAYLDHDLGGQVYVKEREGTGTEVAEFIAAMESDARPWLTVIHSYNPAGALRMENILLQADCNYLVSPFGNESFYRALLLEVGV